VHLVEPPDDDLPGEVPEPGDRFLRACARLPVDCTPVWFMRQAGRYLPEYRALREGTDILELCRTPDLAAEATLQPLRRMPLDAAVLFSDITVPLAAVGLGVRIVAGTGPVVADPIRAPADVERIPALEPERDEPFVLETVRILRKELAVPLIGFAGAPFTLASYLIEGGPSRDHARTKAFMLEEPEAWGVLMGSLGAMTLTHLRAQVEAGAQAVQVFDSWAGALDPDDYTHFVLPVMRDVFSGLAELDVPRIHFGVGTAELLTLMRDAGADVVGVDWRVPLHRAWERIGYDVAIQGNLDPAACLAPWDVVEAKALAVLRRAAGGPGPVFNLGHGVLPETAPDTLERLVDLVHERTEHDESDEEP